jgi:hypothetical protein
MGATGPTRRQETAYFNTGMTGNAQNSTSLTAFGSQQVSTYLSGIFPEQEDSLFTYYRDIYSFDPVAGCAVDLISTLPFSDWTLSGAKDEILQKFNSSLDQLNLKIMLPEISLDYLVLGAFVGSLVFNRGTKEFTEIITHPRDQCKVQATPFHGVDPFIEVRSDPELRKFLNSDDPRAQQLRGRVNSRFLDAMKAPKFNLDPLTTLWLPRKTYTNSTGTSYYRRLLPFYFLEKLLFRGTLTEAAKRQRSMLHLQAGDEIWEPTPEDLNALVALFQQAELDPLGAIVATRNAVNPSEIRQGGDFWKWTDLMNDTTAAKLRALGISEAFLSGETNFATSEVALTVFLENLKSFRQMLTYRLFTNKLFPLISVINGFVRGDDKKVLADLEENITDRNRIQTKLSDTTKLIIPKMNWHKNLEPKTDSSYLDVLTQLQEKGIPIPLRVMAAAGGLTLDSLIQDLTEEKDQVARLKKLAPSEGGEGGDDFENVESSTLREVTSRALRRKEWLSRDYGEAMEVRGRTKTGQPKYLFDQKAANEEINKVIAKALKHLSDPTHYKRQAKEIARHLGRMDTFSGA